MSAKTRTYPASFRRDAGGDDLDTLEVEAKEKVTINGRVRVRGPVTVAKNGTLEIVDGGYLIAETGIANLGTVAVKGNGTVAYG